MKPFANILPSLLFTLLQPVPTTPSTLPIPSILPLPVAPQNNRVSYTSSHVYAINPTTSYPLSALESRFETYPYEIGPEGFVVVVPESGVDDFKQELERDGLGVQLLDGDLGRSMESERFAGYTSQRALQKRGEEADVPGIEWFDAYHSYAEHLDFWDDLAAAVPRNSEKVNLGPSYENRTIWAYHFFGDRNGSGAYGTGKREEKPVILWHATVHAREWISTAVIEYLVWKLVTGWREGDGEVRAWLGGYDFWAVPFHNPDGFVHTQTTDRLWRKNRQPRPNTTCIGTDGNRNWDFAWNASDPSGAAPAGPCAQTFRGLAPGDTPENKALSSLSATLSRTEFGIRSFIDWHSYGQQVATPYGYTCDEVPASLPRMLEVAGGTAAAIEAASERGSVYEFGPGCRIIYFSAGNSRDIHYRVFGANHSWTLELSPADAAGGGFVLPAEQIGSVVREQWEGQRWLLGNVTVD